MQMELVTTDVVKNESSEILRKPYQAPALAQFGAIHHATQGGSTGTMSDGVSGMFMTSDERAKENIQKLGNHPAGFGLYLFDYKPEFQHCGAGRHFGVMAQEVERVIPEAVSTDGNGYRQVDYSLLGMTLTKH